jgi:hypothetical protein
VSSPDVLLLLLLMILAESLFMDGNRMSMDRKILDNLPGWALYIQPICTQLTEVFS